MGEVEWKAVWGGRWVLGEVEWKALWGGRWVLVEVEWKAVWGGARGFALAFVERSPSG